MILINFIIKKRIQIKLYMLNIIIIVIAHLTKISILTMLQI